MRDQDFYVAGLALMCCAGTVAACEFRHSLPVASSSSFSADSLIIRGQINQMEHVPLNYTPGGCYVRRTVSLAQCKPVGNAIHVTCWKTGSDILDVFEETSAFKQEWTLFCSHDQGGA